MQFIKHDTENSRIIEIQSSEILINNSQDALDLLATIQYQHQCRNIILPAQCLTKDFFALSNGLAGKILQKFSNYQMRMALVGDFSDYTSKSLRDFIYESNKNKQIMFLSDIESAIKAFSSSN